MTSTTSATTTEDGSMTASSHSDEVSSNTSSTTEKKKSKKSKKKKKKKTSKKKTKKQKKKKKKKKRSSKRSKRSKDSNSSVSSGSDSASGHSSTFDMATELSMQLRKNKHHHKFRSKNVIIGGHWGRVRFVGNLPKHEERFYGVEVKDLAFAELADIYKKWPDGIVYGIPIFEPQSGNKAVFVPHSDRLLLCRAQRCKPGGGHVAGERVVKVDRGSGRTYHGTVEYMGELHGKAGEWWGISFDEKNVGKHDGKVFGRRYFKCPPGRGIMCKPAHVLAHLKGLSSDFSLDSDAESGSDFEMESTRQIATELKRLQSDIHMMRSDVETWQNSIVERELSTQQSYDGYEVTHHVGSSRLEGPLTEQTGERIAFEGTCEQLEETPDWVRQSSDIPSRPGHRSPSPRYESEHGSDGSWVKRKVKVRKEDSPERRSHRRRRSKQKESRLPKRYYVDRDAFQDEDVF